MDNVVALASGGKDSFHSLLHVMAQGHVPRALCNLTPAPVAAEPAGQEIATDNKSNNNNNNNNNNSNTQETADELDSFMFQTVGHDIIDSYAATLPPPEVLRTVIESAFARGPGRHRVKEENKVNDDYKFPVFRAQIVGTSANVGPGYYPTGSNASAGAIADTEGKSEGGKGSKSKDEVEDLYDILLRIKSDIPEINAVSCGAILSNYQRVRVESVCERLGLKLYAPLWRMDQTHLMAEMIETGLNSVIVKVACLGLNDRDLGKPLATLYPKLLRLYNDYGCNVCGEGGEFETVTLDSPMFIRRVELAQVETVLHSDDMSAPTSYLKLNKCVPVDKFDLHSAEKFGEWQSNLVSVLRTLRDRYSISGKESNIPLVLGPSAHYDTLSSATVFKTNFKSSFLAQSSPKTRGTFNNIYKSINKTLNKISHTSQHSAQYQPESVTNSTVTESPTGSDVPKDSSKKMNIKVSPTRNARANIQQADGRATSGNHHSVHSHIPSIPNTLSSNNSGTSSIELSKQFMSKLKLHNLDIPDDVIGAQPGAIQEGWQGASPYVVGGKYISINGLTISSLSGGAKRYTGLSIGTETEALLTYLVAQLDRTARVRQNGVNNGLAALVRDQQNQQQEEARDEANPEMVARVALMFVSLKDMSKFADFNTTYKTFFGPDTSNIYFEGQYPYVASNCSPPVRVCVSTDLDSPANIQIDCLAYLEPKEVSASNGADKPTSDSTDFMHVQSVSYWAPANIGPYSQTCTIQESKDILCAGQIGLVPSKMDLPKVNGLTGEGISINAISLIDAASETNPGMYSYYGSLDTTVTTTLTRKSIGARVNLISELATLYAETQTTLQNFSQVIFGCENPSESTVTPKVNPSGDISGPTIRNRAALVIEFLRKIMGGVVMLSSSRLAAIKTAFSESLLLNLYDETGEQSPTGSIISLTSYDSTPFTTYIDHVSKLVAVDVLKMALTDFFIPYKEQQIKGSEVQELAEFIFSGVVNSNESFDDLSFVYPSGNKDLDFEAEHGLYQLEELLTDGLTEGNKNALVCSGWDTKNLKTVYESYVSSMVESELLPISFTTARMLPKNAFVELCFSFAPQPSETKLVAKFLKGLTSEVIGSKVQTPYGSICPVIEQIRGQVFFESHVFVEGFGTLRSLARMTVMRGAPLVYTINVTFDAFKSILAAQHEGYPSSQDGSMGPGMHGGRAQSSHSGSSRRQSLVSIDMFGDQSQRVYRAIAQLVGQQVERIVQEYFKSFALCSNESYNETEGIENVDDMENEDEKAARHLKTGPWTVLSNKNNEQKTQEIQDTTNKAGSALSHLATIGRATADIDPELHGVHSVQVLYKSTGALGVSGAHIAAALHTPLAHASAVRVAVASGARASNGPFHDAIDNQSTSVLALLPLAASYVAVDDVLSSSMLSWSRQDAGIVAISGRIAGTW